MTTGHCLCGNVRFELDGEPLAAGYCHCTRCQRRSGTAAAATAGFPVAALRVTAGDELVRWWRPPEGFEKAFCRDCGAALFSRPAGGGDIVGVRLGALDPGHGIRPTFRQHVGTAAEWEPVPDDGLQRYEAART